MKKSKFTDSQILGILKSGKAISTTRGGASGSRVQTGQRKAGLCCGWYQ